MRVVIDTNDFISALIGKKHREKLSIVLNHPSVEIFGDEELIAEIRDVGFAFVGVFHQQSEEHLYV